MDLTYFFPPDMIEMMKAIKTMSDGDPEKSIRSFERNDFARDTIRAVYKFINDGPKMFECPATLGFVASQLDLNFPSTYYTQPYPATMIHIENGGHILTVIGKDHIVVMTWVDSRRYETFAVKLVSDLTIDQVINMQDWSDVRKWTVRLGLKINTILMWAGVALRGYYDEKAAARSKRSGRFQVRNIERIYIPQEIDVMDRLKRAILPPTKYESDPTGRTVRPHFRNAHMRMVRYGKNRELRRLRLIPCCFVNKDKFRGDTAETETIYS